MSEDHGKWRRCTAEAGVSRAHVSSAYGPEQHASRSGRPWARFLAANNVYSAHTRISLEEGRKCLTKTGSKRLRTAEE